jgi:hypothetical protein
MSIAHVRGRNTTPLQRQCNVTATWPGRQDLNFWKDSAGIILRYSPTSGMQAGFHHLIWCRLPVPVL